MSELWPPRLSELHGYAIIRADPVATIYPSRRCGAPGCGDKIKGEGQTVRLLLASDPPREVFVHIDCCTEEALTVHNWVGA